MLITLLTIAIASLAAAPVIVPVVRRLSGVKEELEPLEHSPKAKAIDQDLEGTELNLAEEAKRSGDSASSQAAPPILLDVIPDFSLEMIRSPKTGDKTTKPIVEVIWQNPGALDQKNPKTVHLDAVEMVRRTPSADLLFDDSKTSDEQRHVIDSVNPDEPPRLISPQPIAKPPVAAQTISAASFAQPLKSSPPTDDPDKTSTSKAYSVNSEKFKMRPVIDQGGSKRSAAIPMMISEVPSAIKRDQHFEVIKPIVPKQDKRFSLLDQPEEMAVGERAWRSVQPLYIDFSPFFSLDSLIDITPSLSSSSANRKKAINSRGEKTRARHRKEQGQKGRSADDRREVTALHAELLRDLNAENDRFNHKRYHELDHDFDDDDSGDEELEWSTGETIDIDDLEDVPEWQSLLSLSSNFLFDLKLSQRSKSAHHTLTEQSLEDSIVFKITSGPTGPKIESNQSETQN